MGRREQKMRKGWEDRDRSEEDCKGRRGKDEDGKRRGREENRTEEEKSIR